MVRLVVFAAVIAITFLEMAPASGQITTGTILGTVTDGTGAVVPGVAITIRNVGTGLTRSVVTDDNGRYREPQLPIGGYEVHAELVGFQSQLHRSLQLTVGSDLIVNFTLQVSRVQEVVEVTGQAPIVQSTSAEVAGLMDTRSINELPLNARDIQQLAVLQPGVQQFNYHNFGTQMVVSGTRPEHNRFLLDGVDTTFTFTTSPVSAAGVIMGIEAVQEFKLLASDYGAAYGEKAGGVMNTITKSGTNAFHGSVYEFLRNDIFDARNFFDKGDAPPFRRNQYGASFGGPIVRDKTFFFTNYEGFRQRLGLSHLAIVPGRRARDGYLPDTNNPGREVFVGVASQVRPYLSLFPEANGQTFADGSAEFFSNPKQRIDEDYWTLKTDHKFNDKQSLSATYSGDWSTEFTPTQNPNFADNRDYNKQIVSLQNVYLFSPALINTTRLGINRSWYFFRTDTTVPIDRSLYFVADPFFAPTNVGQFGVVSISGLKGLAETSTGVNITPRWFGYTMVSLNSDLNWNHGNHSFQFGGLVKRWHDNATVANPASRGNFNFLSLRNFLEGRPATFAVYDPAHRNLPRGWRDTLFGGYIEDSIKVRPTLTLTLGARYEYLHGPAEVNGLVTNLRGGILDPEPAVGYPYFKQPKNLLAPRVGLNWDPFRDGKTSVRAGGGIFYDQIVSWYYFLQAPGLMPFTRNVTIANPPFPNALNAIPPTAPVDFTAMQFNAHSPTRYSYNVTIQRDVGGQTALMVAYVGSQSRYLGRTGNQNTFFPQVSSDGRLFWPAGLTQRPNPNFRSISVTQFDANSFYNSFETSLERRVGEGLAFRVNYTFSRCIDDVSNEFGGGSLGGGASLQDVRDRKSSRGPCSFNSDHSANVTTTWDLPMGHGLTGLRGALLTGWRWSTITTIQNGVPLDLTLGFHNSRQGELGTGPDRPSWTPGCTAKSAILGTPEQYFNPDCFIAAEPGFLGNVGSRVLSGPGLITTDWALAKNIRVRERRRVEFRSEVFNLLNHTNFAIPTGRTIFSGSGARLAAAGRITRTVTPSRQIQFGLKYVF